MKTSRREQQDKQERASLAQCYTHLTKIDVPKQNRETEFITLFSFTKLEWHTATKFALSSVHDAFLFHGELFFINADTSRQHNFQHFCGTTFIMFLLSRSVTDDYKVRRKFPKGLLFLLSNILLSEFIILLLLGISGIYFNAVTDRSSLKSCYVSIPGRDPEPLLLSLFLFSYFIPKVHDM